MLVTPSAKIGEFGLNTNGRVVTLRTGMKADLPMDEIWQYLMDGSLDKVGFEGIRRNAVMSVEIVDQGAEMKSEVG